MQTIVKANWRLPGYAAWPLQVGAPFGFFVLFWFHVVSKCVTLSQVLSLAWFHFFVCCCLAYVLSNFSHLLLLALAVSFFSFSIFHNVFADRSDGRCAFRRLHPISRSSSTRSGAICIGVLWNFSGYIWINVNVWWLHFNAALLMNVFYISSLQPNHPPTPPPPLQKKRSPIAFSSRIE